MKTKKTLLIIFAIMCLFTLSCESYKPLEFKNYGSCDGYKIGDTGPADGIIFYDKGSVSDGWRYLEVAPASSEFNAQWGAYEKNVTGTQTGIGTGKSNTDKIVAFLNSAGNIESKRAAQLCVALNIGGKKDWFLPSRDELNLMYVNLHQKGLGDFGKGTNSESWMNWYYWSSSQSSNSIARHQNFYDGSQYLTIKDSTSRVRAVRAF